MYVGLTDLFSSNTNFLIQVNIFGLSFQIQKYSYLSSPCLNNVSYLTLLKNVTGKL